MHDASPSTNIRIEGELEEYVGLYCPTNQKIRIFSFIFLFTKSHKKSPQNKKSTRSQSSTDKNTNKKINQCREDSSRIIVRSFQY
jgi:hypothetical protein